MLTCEDFAFDITCKQQLSPIYKKFINKLIETFMIIPVIKKLLYLMFTFVFP